LSEANHGLAVAAVDTGGTFTDFVLWSGGRLYVRKVPSTPEDPSRALLTGLTALLRATSAGSCGLLIHGSTVATNALLERRGGRVLLVTTAGFEDVLELGRQNRPELYALTGDRPAPLVERRHRLGVGGRIGPTGSEYEALPEQAAGELPAHARAAAADAVAVVLLHSYANGAHEEAIASALRRGGHDVSVSSELLPEYREYERTVATVVNAYVTPRMAGYLGRIEAETPARRVRLMGSGGGSLGLARARRAPVETILSGPAGGVAGALWVAQRHGRNRIMTFDMGGTSTDVSLCPGAPLRTRELVIAGLPVALPMLDIHTVGAGGGSIARCDAGGALRVGPESAGAEPGPIAYGRGGTRLTVTDANVALGRLPSGTGALDLDANLVVEPLAELASALGCSPAEAAAGIVAVVEASMEGALRVISVERGHDPRDFTLVPFGGAAGLHAVGLAERLDIPQLLLPPAPGVLSAYGMLVAPVRKDATRSVLLVDVGDDELVPAFAALEGEALAAMEEEEVAAADVTLSRTVAARYLGQSHELSVGADGWRQRFHAAHAQRFGYSAMDASVEAVTLRVEAVGPLPELPLPHVGGATGVPVVLRRSGVWHAGTTVEAAQHSREDLRSGHELTGPALVIEETATFWLPPGWSGRVLGDGSLLVSRTGASG
jgi:N-methylhydantoinase A